VAFGSMFADRCLKLQPRDQLQHLTENTAYSVQGGISVRCIGSWRTQSNLSRIPPACLSIAHSRWIKSNLDNSGF
jgi:hypothetical protein